MIGTRMGATMIGTRIETKTGRRWWLGWTMRIGAKGGLCGVSAFGIGRYRIFVPIIVPIAGLHRRPDHCLDHCRKPVLGGLAMADC